MLRKLYDFVLRQAASRHATTSLAVVSFTESSFFPIPPDVMLAPMVFARPERAYFYATVCTIGASITSGGTGKNELSVNDTTASEVVAWRPAACRSTKS